MNLIHVNGVKVSLEDIVRMDQKYIGSYVVCTEERKVIILLHSIQKKSTVHASLIRLVLQVNYQ